MTSPRLDEYAEALSSFELKTRSRFFGMCFMHRSHLSRALVESFGNLADNGVLETRRELLVDVAERSIGGDVDALLLAPLNQLRVVEIRVDLMRVRVLARAYSRKRIMRGKCEKPAPPRGREGGVKGKISASCWEDWDGSSKRWAWMVRRTETVPRMQSRILFCP